MKITSPPFLCGPQMHSKQVLLDPPMRSRAAIMLEYLKYAMCALVPACARRHMQDAIIVNVSKVQATSSIQEKKSTALSLTRISHLSHTA